MSGRAGPAVGAGTDAASRPGSVPAAPPGVAVLAALLALAAAAGCGGEGPPPPVAVADSAGVRVVRSHRPAWAEGEAWRVAGRPEAVLSGLPGSFRPEAVRRLSDGRLAALDPDGRRLAIGPELVEIPPAEGVPAGPATLAALLPGDTLAVGEARGAAVHLFGPDGGRGRTLRLEGPGPGRFIPRILGGFADGALVAVPPFERVVFPGGKVLRDTLPLLTFGREGALEDTLGALASAERFFARVQSEAGPLQGRVRRPYAREELAAVADTVLVTADNGGLTWEARDRTGALRLRSAAPFRTRRVGAEDIAAYREEALRRAPGEFRALRRKLLREVPFPGRKPVLADLLVDATGHVWAGLAGGPWRPPTEWRVFAPDGRWLGTVSTPSGLEVQQVGADFVAGIRRGADDAPAAVVHRLVKPAGPDRPGGAAGRGEAPTDAGAGGRGDTAGPDDPGDRADPSGPRDG